MEIHRIDYLRSQQGLRLLKNKEVHSSKVYSQLLTRNSTDRNRNQIIEVTEKTIAHYQPRQENK